MTLVVARSQRERAGTLALCEQKRWFQTEKNDTVCTRRVCGEQTPSDTSTRVLVGGWMKEDARYLRSGFPVLNKEQFNREKKGGGALAY